MTLLDTGVETFTIRLTLDRGVTVSEYLETNRVAASNYKRAVDALGEQGVVDLVGVCGYYMLVSMTLNVFEMPLPAGVPDPLA